MFSDNWRLAVTKEMAPELYEAFISFLTVATEPYNGSGYYNDDVVVAIWSAIALRNRTRWLARSSIRLESHSRVFAWLYSGR